METPDNKMTFLFGSKVNMKIKVGGIYLMNSKRFALVLAVMLVISMSASVVAANPFADVPAHHWAYDSIVQLQAVGLIEGYPDGTYGGAKTLTRYEAAMVFARALANLEALVESNTADSKAELLAELDAVSAEISDLIVAEFEKLGITVSDVGGRDASAGSTIDRDLVMTPEAEAAIASLVAELAKKELAAAAELAKETIVDTGVIERVVVDEVDAAVIEAIVEEVVAASLYSIEAQVASNASYVDMVTNRINDRLGRLTRNVDTLAADQAAEFEVVHGLVAGLRGDVDVLLAGIDGKVLDLAGNFVKVNNEFDAELALLGVRIDELESLYANVDNRVSVLEKDVVALQADMEDAKAGVKLTGSLEFDAVTRRVLEVDEAADGTKVETKTASADGLFNKNYKSTTALGLDSGLVAKLGAQIDEGTEVKLTLEADGATLNNIELDSYLLEIVSDGTINHFALGDVEDLVKNRFDQNVTVFDPDYGVVAGLDLAGFDVNALASKGVVALSADYQIWPALGFRLSGSNVVGPNLGPANQNAVAVGVYGDVLGVNYDAKVALDRYAANADKNLLIDLNVDADFGILEVGANYATAGENFGTGALTKTNFYDNDSLNKLALDASANLFGVNLAAGTYFENDDAARTVEATMFNAGYDLDLFLPLELSAAYGWKLNDVDPAEKDVHTQLKVGIDGLELFGVELGTSYTFVNNYLSGNWRDPSKWVGQDAHIITADLGYGFDRLDLGYDFEYTIPRNDTADEFGNQMSHLLKADYDFADGVSLNVAAKQVNFSTIDAAKAATDYKVQEVKAGVGVAF